MIAAIGISGRSSIAITGLAPTAANRSAKFLPLPLVVVRAAVAECSCSVISVSFDLMAGMKERGNEKSDCCSERHRDVDLQCEHHLGLPSNSSPSEGSAAVGPEALFAP